MSKSFPLSSVKCRLKLLLIVAIGVLAYIVEDSKILGFEIDKTTIKGNLLFGVLVGCLGLEGVINRIRDFAQGHGAANPSSASNREPATPPQNPTAAETQ